MKLLTLLLIFVSLPCFSSVSKSDSINWYVNHAPPSSFTHGEFQGQGFIDQALALIQAQLPQYQHNMIPSDIAIATAHLKQGRALCFPAMVKRPERESFVYFSQMSVMHPSNYIALSPELAKRKGQVKQVDLQALLNSDDIYLGIRDGFAFGGIIDDLILKYGANSTMTFREHQSLPDMYKLLAESRIDYLIGYPFESSFVLSEFEFDGDVVNLPIKGAPRFSMGAVGCTKDTWGQKVITDINVALTMLKPQEKYKKALTSWMEEFIDMKAYNQFYETEFLKK